MYRCVICNSTNIRFVREIKTTLFGGSYDGKNYYRLYKCKNCKSRFFKVNNVDIKDLYNKNHNKFYKQTRSHKFVKSESWLYQKKIIECVLGYRPSSILDVGCRMGDFLLHFDSSVIKEGVELDKHAFNIAENRGGGMHIYNGSIEEIEINRKYDVVTAFAVIEHLKQPCKVLKKLSCLVKKNGVLVIMIPTYQCLKEKVITDFIRKLYMGKEWHMYSPPAHINFISKQYLDSYLNKKGFLLEKRIYTTGGMVSFPFKIPLISEGFNKLIFKFDRSIFNEIPIFDHMYSFYRKL